MKNTTFILRLFMATATLILCVQTNIFATSYPPSVCSLFAHLSPNRTITLQEGEPIYLELTSDINPDNIEVNNTINFRVISNVLVEGKEVIRAFTPAVGVVNRIEHSTTNTGAKIQVTVRHIRAVDGQQILVDGPTNLMAANIGTNVTVYVKNKIEIKL